MIKKYVLLSILFLAFSLSTVAQSGCNTCADSTTYGVEGGLISIDADVENPNNAVDGDTSTHSTLKKLAGVLGVNVFQTIIFPDTGAAGSSVSFLLEDPTIANVNLLGYLRVESFLGGVSNNDAIAVNPSVVTALQSNKFIVDFIAGADFDRVKITLDGGVLNVSLGHVNVYSVCYEENYYEQISPISDAVGVGGGVCVGCGVTNRVNSRDGDINSFSRLNLFFSIGSPYVYQEWEFANTSCVGEEFEIILGDAGGLLDVALLGGGLELKFYNNSSLVETHDIQNTGLLDAVVIAGTQRNRYVYTPTHAYDEVRLTLDGGFIGASQTIYVYEVYQRKLAPPPTQTINICEGETATFNLNACTDIKFYETDVSTTVLGTNSFTTPVLMSDASYFAEAVTATGCPSTSRTEVFVNVSDKPDMPITITHQ